MSVPSWIRILTLIQIYKEYECSGRKRFFLPPAALAAADLLIKNSSWMFYPGGIFYGVYLLYLFCHIRYFLQIMLPTRNGKPSELSSPEHL